MTRFNITMHQAVELILRSLKNGHGGEIFVPKLKAYKVATITEAIVELLNANNEIEIISARHGEKYHEALISKDEIRNTYENETDYILVDKLTQHLNSNIMPTLQHANFSDEYSSDKVDLLSKEDLKQIILDEGLINSNNK